MQELVSWTTWWIFIKLGVDIMSFDAASHLYILIACIYIYATSIASRSDIRSILYRVITFFWQETLKNVTFLLWRFVHHKINVAFVWNIYLAFYLMTITNGLLQIGIWNLVWTWIIKESIDFVCCISYMYGKNCKHSSRTELVWYVWQLSCRRTLY
jgi:hypothetical protein